MITVLTDGLPACWAPRRPPRANRHAGSPRPALCRARPKPRCVGLPVGESPAELQTELCS
jgi:hypothetical protein